MSLLSDSEAVLIDEAGRRRVAAVVNYRDVERLDELERDLVDLALVLARAASDTGRRTGLDEAIGSLGYSREQLAAMDDPA